MVYAKYVKYKGKKKGPYYYSSVRKGGKVGSIYLGKDLVKAKVKEAALQKKSSSLKMHKPTSLGKTSRSTTQSPITRLPVPPLYLAFAIIVVFMVGVQYLALGPTGMVTLQPTAISGTGCDYTTGWAYPHWTINNSMDCTVTNDDFVLEGNLTINGTLRFSNVTLRVNATADGSHFILLNSGGRFTINESSTITNNATAAADYDFTINGSFDLRDSTIKYVNSPIDVYSDYANFTNLTYTNPSGSGIYFNGSTGGRIVGSSLTSSSSADVDMIWIVNGAVNTSVINSTILMLGNTAEGIHIQDSTTAGTLIQGNTINATATTNPGALLISNVSLNTTILNNTMYGDSWVMKLVNAHNITIQDNFLRSDEAYIDRAHPLQFTGGTNTFNTIDGNTMTIRVVDPNGEQTSGIYFAAGTYKDNVIQNNNISIVLPPGSAVSYAGITFFGTDDVIHRNVIQNNTITTKSTGAYIKSTNAVNNSISGNTIIASGNSIAHHGVHIENNAQNTIISNNTITTTELNSYGIYINTNQDSDAISGNVITTGGTGAYGIYLLSTGGVTNGITNNTVNTTGTSSFGLYHAGGASATGINVTGNTVTTTSTSGNPDAIRFETPNNNISSNVISSTGDYGIISGASNIISFNTITMPTASSYGIRGGSANNISSNTVTMEGLESYAILPTTGDISNNTLTVTGTSSYGVLVYAGNDVTGNTITTNNSNSWGLYIAGASVLITNNTVTTTHDVTSYAAYVSVSANNAILRGNTFTANGSTSSYAVYINQRTNVLIENSTIISNSPLPAIYADRSPTLQIANSTISSNGLSTVLLTGSSGSATFTNVTGVNSSLVNITSGSAQTATIYEYLDLDIQDWVDATLQNATVIITDGNNATALNQTTNSTTGTISIPLLVAIKNSTDTNESTPRVLVTRSNYTTINQTISLGPGSNPISIPVFAIQSRCSGAYAGGHWIVSTIPDCSSETSLQIEGNFTLQNGTELNFTGLNVTFGRYVTINSSSTLRIRNLRGSEVARAMRNFTVNGTFILDNATFRLNATSNGSSLFKVSNGSTLNLTNDAQFSAGSDTSPAYMLVFQPGAVVFINNSTISGAGYANGSQHEGVIVNTNNNTITNSVFTNNYHGLRFESVTNGAVSDNTFSNNDVAISASGSSSITIWNSSTTNSSVYAIVLNDTTNLTTSNVSYNISDALISGSGILTKNSYSKVDVTNGGAETIIFAFANGSNAFSGSTTSSGVMTPFLFLDAEKNNTTTTQQSYTVTATIPASWDASATVVIDTITGSTVSYTLGSIIFTATPGTDYTIQQGTSAAAAGSSGGGSVTGGLPSYITMLVPEVTIKVSDSIISEAFEFDVDNIGRLPIKNLKVSVLGFPAGVSAQVDPVVTALNPGDAQSFSVTLTVDPSTPIGEYLLTITARDGDTLLESATTTLIIQSPEFKPAEQVKESIRDVVDRLEDPQAQRVLLTASVITLLLVIGLFVTVKKTLDES